MYIYCIDKEIQKFALTNTASISELTKITNSFNTYIEDANFFLQIQNNVNLAF